MQKRVSSYEHGIMKMKCLCADPICTELNIITNNTSARFYILTAIVLRVQASLDKTLCR
jgi:hypothetical protein